MAMLSGCCGTEVDGVQVDMGICPECYEHCDFECDECGNSGTVFNTISREWEECECGQEFNGEKAAAFYQLWNQKVFQ
jgi:hypothetical protein